jgi:GAF domain-containing protein
MFARPATAPVRAALDRHQVIQCGLSDQAEQVVRAAAEAESVPVRALSLDLVRETLADGWSTVLISSEAAGRIAGEIAEADAKAAARCEEPARVIVVTETSAGEDEAAGIAAERLVWPFTVDYARVRIRAAVLRAECRWQRAPLPADEVRRLQDLHELEIIDTVPEERFDRIARVAARALHAPMALITFIDEHRQWFKSCIGLELRETTREVAFCAHAILRPGTMVVADTLEDRRFAENPAVTGGPRIRFYAGTPIRSRRGMPLGTLCVIDTRPREFDPDQVALLEDLASLVEEQLAP